MIETATGTTPATATDGPRPDSAAIVARNAAAGLAARVGLKILGFAFTVYVVRSLGAAHYGQYSAVVAFVGLFGVFSDLGVVSYATREMSEQPQEIRELVPDMIAIRVLLSLGIIVVAPLSALWLGKEPDIVRGIALASLGLIVYGIQGPLYSALAARERLDSLAGFSVVSQLAFWIAATLLLVLGVGYIGLIAASLLRVVVGTLLSGRMVWRLRGFKVLSFSVKRWPNLLHRSLPFAVSAVSFTIVNQFGQAFMSFQVSDTQLGLYSAAYGLVLIAMFLPQSFAIALYPTLVRELYAESNTGTKMIKRSLVYIMTAAMPLVVGGALLADRLIPQLYGAEFTGAVPVFRVFLYSLPIRFVLELLGRVSSALHLESRTARSNVASAVVTVTLTLLLVPRLGIVGGAVALLASGVLRLVWLWLLIGTDRLLGDWRIPIRISAAAAVMGLGVRAVGDIPLPFVIVIGASLYCILVLAFRAIKVHDLHLLRRALIRQADL